MRLRWPLLLPVAALLVVLALLGGALALDRGGSEGHPATTSAPQNGEPSAREAGPASVCSGSSSRRSADEPRVFADIYTQRVQELGIYIVADDRVSAEAIERARQTLRAMFRDNDLEKDLAAQGAYVIIADSTQLNVLDLPEFGCLAFEPGAQRFDHVCGVADAADYPVATVNELDLLGRRSGPCGGLNILYHEVGHLVQKWTLNHSDYLEIRNIYQDALNAGKYRNEYASTNANEYFAEATQAFFFHAEPGGRHDREWLAQYDPALYALLQRIYEPE